MLPAVWFHPSAGECLPPPLGGGSMLHKPGTDHTVVSRFGLRYRFPGLLFEEMSQAFVDMNSGFVLRLNLCSGCFSVRFLVKKICDPNQRLLKI